MWGVVKRKLERRSQLTSQGNEGSGKLWATETFFQHKRNTFFLFSQTRDNSDHLKVASVFVEWVVAEVHQAGDLDGDLDVEGDPL